MADRRIVKLNVGGMFYTTTRETLLSQQDTLFHDILSKESNWPRDERGSYFIDRDGHLFRYVLNFMRTSKLLLPNGFRELLMLKEEADYFEIDLLLQRIDSLEQNRRKHCKSRRKKSFHSSLEVLNLNRSDFELIGDNEWWEG
ncbi:BTB/POZ domain-containing protein KCTD6-like [Argonauta hians]